jgi:hypothetical protein
MGQHWPNRRWFGALYAAPSVETPSARREIHKDRVTDPHLFDLFIERGPDSCEMCGMLSAETGLRHEVVVADLPLFNVEMYTPGEIVEARKSFNAETAADALLAATAWINDSAHNATHFRVVDLHGITVFDRPVANFDQ